MNYYQRMRDLREDHDKTQKEIADVLGIRQSDYSKYERGVNMMGLDKYIVLAEYYNVSLDYLAGLISVPEKLYRFNLNDETERKKTTAKELLPV